MILQIFETEKHMKKIFIAGVMLFTATSFSQSINDAILFSGNDDIGTARYQAMSGAFGALGGDLSAINVNPAGGAVFKKSTIGVSLSTFHKENDVFYGLTNTSTNSDSSDLSINQAGGVLVLPAPSAKWKKVVLGINYQQTQNFDQDLFVAGTNNVSISQYFLNRAHGIVPFRDIELFNGDIIEHRYLDAAAISYKSSTSVIRCLWRYNSAFTFRSDLKS